MQIGVIPAFALSGNYAPGQELCHCGHQKPDHSPKTRTNPCERCDCPKYSGDPETVGVDLQVVFGIPTPWRDMTTPWGGETAVDPAGDPAGTSSSAA